MLELLETKIDKKRDEVIPQQWIYLLNVNIEIDKNGNMKGYMTINHSADIFYDRMNFVNNNYVLDTKLNIQIDKPYIIGDVEFIEYNIPLTMAYIIGNTQPFTQKMSLEAEIQLQRMELKNNRVFRIYMKKYGQTKIYTNNEKRSEPIHGEDEMTIFEKSQIMETKKLKQSTSNVVKVIKVFGNDETELSENTIKLVLGLYTNAIIDIAEQTLKRIIAKNWKVLSC